MSTRDQEPHARAHDGPDPLDLSSRSASRAEKASDCAARLSDWERAETIREVRRLLAVAMRGLSLRERLALRCRYWQGMTLDETGRVIGRVPVSREVARQVEARAIHKLRHPRRREVRVAGDLLGLHVPSEWAWWRQ